MDSLQLTRNVSTCFEFRFLTPTFHIRLYWQVANEFVDCGMRQSYMGIATVQLLHSKSLNKSKPLNISRNKIISKNKKINNILLPFICMCTCNLFPFGCNQTTTTSWKAIIGQEIVSESKFNFPRHAILCFLIGHGHVTTKKMLQYNHVHYELNKLYFFMLKMKRI